MSVFKNSVEPDIPEPVTIPLKLFSFLFISLLNLASKTTDS